MHVEASIPPPDQVPYIGRKGIPTQNVMATCNFDMQFTFACVGWEDTAHDTRAFLSVLRNSNLNFSKPPNGNLHTFIITFYMLCIIIIIQNKIFNCQENITW